MTNLKSNRILVLIISAAFLIEISYVSSQNTFQVQSASAANTNSTNGFSGATLLSAKEVKDGVYNWISGSNGAANPTIKALVNSKNIIKIQNPTDTKHELIIDTGTDVLPSSDDIAPNGSGQLVFNPTSTGTFTYHCAYHPFTMKGIIHVVSVK